MSKSIYDYKFNDAKSEALTLEKYKGKVLLIVNTASECGFTGQYDGLEKMYDDYKEEGLEVLAFPCNQFGGQEPGGSEEIQAFCTMKFNIKFPVFEKVDVNGDNALSLFSHLKEEAPGLLGSKAIKWNFTKFLVGRDGEVIKRYAPKDTPEKIAKEIKKYL